jgi:DNA-binding LacI/PurR family transcriptional regulator
MHDVARLAGVSHQTVSRVLNGHPKVSEETRRRVRAAITELHYRPNGAARALVTGRADVIGVVTTRATAYGTSATVAAFERAAAEADLGVHLTSVPDPDATSLRRAADRLLEQGIAGLAVLAPVSCARGVFGDVIGRIPLVALGGSAGSNLPVVGADQVGGAREATRHLLAAGHRTVWHVGGPGGWLDSRDRAQGWRLALCEAGAVEPPVVTASDWSSGSGYAAGLVLRHRPDVTAVFAASDHLALGVLRALHECDVDAPGRVAVVGFDDVPEAAHFCPPLTTVRPDFEAIGREAMRLLLAQVRSGSRSVGGRMIRPQLVVRASAPR